MKVLVMMGLMYLPYLMQLLFIIGIAFLFSRTRSVPTGMMLLGFLLPLLAFLPELRQSGLLLSNIGWMLKVGGLFGYLRSIPVRPAAAPA